MIVVFPDRQINNQTNMKNNFKAIVLSGFIALLATNVTAQEQPELINHRFQITLFTPFGTNGPSYKQCVNTVSLNLLWGVNAGLKGLEFGGIANIERRFVQGAQFAGVANLVSGPVTGAQFAQLLNIAEGDVIGGQLSGFMNLSGDLYGAAGAGFMNIQQRVTGFQGAGFMNIAEDAKGVQASGFMNAADDVNGAQLSGFLNAADDVKGAQVSGFLNIAKTVRGTQIGFINIADDYEKGVPIGFLNIVKNGIHEFEIAGSELWNFNAGYRIGVDKLYTQFLIGTHWERDAKFWGFGVGIGTRFDITHYFKGTLDLTTYQLMEHRHMYSETPNLLEQLRLTVEGRIFRDLKWFVGPTFNMLFIPFEYPEPAILDVINPWTVIESTSGVSYLRLWPGISGGIRF
jgi:hypothetical protein